MLPAFARRHGFFLALFGLALALRAWALDAIPAPCDDEGNWTWIAFELSRGRPAVLPPDARFVSLTFARLIALSFAHFGATFASARAVCVAGVLLGMVLVHVSSTALGLRRAGGIVAAVLAVHPWSVAWSRTVSVPYALSLAIATAGPMAFLVVVRSPPSWKRGLGLIATSQLLMAGMHFSPLGALPIAACGLWLVVRREHRAWLRDPALYAAMALGLLELVPIVRGALSVVERGTTQPSVYFTAFGSRLYTFFRTTLGGLGGEATLRHFTGNTLPWPFEALVIACVIAVIALTVSAAISVRARFVESDARPTALGEFRAFSLGYLALAAIGLPLILAPARTWNLAAVNSERYVFALLAPFALVLGALASDTRAARRAAASAFVVYLAIGPTARMAREFTAGGSVDRGDYLLDGGGGHRGWRSARERVATPWLIEREVARVAGATPATILVADYAFHPLHFANAETPFPTVDVSKFGMPSAPGRRFFFVVWSVGLLAPEFMPRAVVDANTSLRRSMQSDRFFGLTRVRSFEQPNAMPLFEVWTAVQR